MIRHEEKTIDLSYFLPQPGDIKSINSIPHDFTNFDSNKLPQNQNLDDEVLTGNCGPASVFNTLSILLKSPPKLESVIDTCKKFGANKEGMDDDQIQKTLINYGLNVSELKIKSTTDLIPTIKSGGIAITAIIEADEKGGKLVDAGGHWFVAVDVNKSGDVLVLNSSTRKPKTSFGLDIYKNEYFMKVLTDFEGKSDGKFVYPPSTWYDKLVIAVK